MSRFQSRLFNWIERSLPVELGRRARRIFNQISHNLADKLAQIIAENETIDPAVTDEPAVKQLPASYRFLLKPAYALVKYLAGGTRKFSEQLDETEAGQRSKTEGMIIFAQIEAQNPEPIPDSHQAENDPTAEYVKQIHELIQKAITYFRKKQRTLPAPTLPKAQQGTIVPRNRSEISHDLPYEEPIVSWLDDPQLLKPQPNLTVVTGTNLPEVEIMPEPEEDYFMRAWLESQVLLINYGDSWAVKLLLWLDRLVSRLEKWLSKIWQKLATWWRSKFSKV